MKPRDEQIEFVRLNGRRVAACAWQGYQDKGRGLVCMMSDLHQELLHQVPLRFPARDRNLEGHRPLVRHEGIEDGFQL